MSEMKSVAQWMAARGLALADLVERSRLERRVVEAIVAARYTPSPEQRERLAAALSVAADQVVWGHEAPVEHIHGHGPQFGRSP
jgi:ribosome-binding protein aMBF1 (putative translation factor)